MKPSPAARPGPNRDAALQQYRRRSATYDLQLAAFEPIRRLAIECLELRHGQTVLDVGCGTGLSLPGLQLGVGDAGQIVGIEQCPEMIERARGRVSTQRFRNVRLLCAPAEEAELSGLADAALFHFTHDIMRRPEAIEHVLQHLRPGARVVATGLCWAAPWALPVNCFVWGAAMLSVSSFNGLDRPWNLLAAKIDTLRVRELAFGGVFIAEGTIG